MMRSAETAPRILANSYFRFMKVRYAGRFVHA